VREYKLTGRAYVCDECKEKKKCYVVYDSYICPDCLQIEFHEHTDDDIGTEPK
jgi:hypothetical protein